MSDNSLYRNDRSVWDMLLSDVTQRFSVGKWRNPDWNERTKGSETPPRTGAGTTAEETGNMKTEAIQKKHESPILSVTTESGDFL